MANFTASAPTEVQIPTIAFDDPRIVDVPCSGLQHFVGRETAIGVGLNMIREYREHGYPYPLTVVEVVGHSGGTWIAVAKA